MKVYPVAAESSALASTPWVDGTAIPSMLVAATRTREARVWNFILKGSEGMSRCVELKVWSWESNENIRHEERAQVYMLFKSG